MDASHTKSILLVRVSGVVCGLPVRDVIETMRRLGIQPVANTPEFIEGVSVIRGAIVPVVRLKSFLAGENQESSANRFVTIRVDNRCIALVVDSVIGVAEVSETAMEEMPPLIKGVRSEIIQAIGILHAELLVVLRAARIVPESVWTMLDKREAAAL